MMVRGPEFKSQLCPLAELCDPEQGTQASVSATSKIGNIKAVSPAEPLGALTTIGICLTCGKSWINASYQEGRSEPGLGTSWLGGENPTPTSVPAAPAHPRAQ